MPRIRADYVGTEAPTPQCCAMPKQIPFYLARGRVSSWVGHNSRQIKARVLGWNYWGCQKYSKWEIDGLFYCDQHRPRGT